MRPKTRKEYRKRRHLRVRKKINGTPERPRMAIAKSNRHLYVQFIDDESAVTLASVCTVRGDEQKNVGGATALGRRAAEAALAKGISRVVVDRGGCLFHGRVKAVVDAAVEAGLSIRTSGEERAEAEAPVSEPQQDG